LGQLVELAQQRSPFRIAASSVRKVVETFLRQEGKRGAENAAADGGNRLFAKELTVEGRLHRLSQRGGSRNGSP
jgi:hypothetical protein